MSAIDLPADFAHICGMQTAISNDKKELTIVMGLPGSGKSYFASHLARELNAEYLSSDKVRKKLSTKADYGKENKRQVYQVLAKMAGESLDSNRDVVVDATFHLQEFRDFFIDTFQKKASQLHWILVEADESLIKQRVARPRKDSDADFEVYQLLKEEYEPLKSPFLKLTSMDGNLPDMIEKAKNYLGMYE